MRKNNRRIFLILSCFVAILLVGGIIYTSISTPIDKSGTSYVYVDSDDNADSVCKKVAEILPNVSELMFNLMANTSHYSQNIHTGRYAISQTTTTLELFLAMRGHHTVPIDLIIPSVRTVEEMADRISRQIMIDNIALSAYFHDSVNCRKLGFTPETLPALFIPDTYEVYWDCSIDRLMEKLQDGYNHFWNNNRLAKARSMNMTPVEIATLASIVESETYLEEEKPIVAGLYINRLRRGMKLQSCPTVIFAIGDFTIQRVLKNQLETDSPYNTYKYPGLPPGPIRIPSQATIDHVLNYQHHDYLYMCAKDDLSGHNVFTSNSLEHQRNAIRYQRALNHRGIRQ